MVLLLITIGFQQVSKCHFTQRFMFAETDLISQTIEKNSIRGRSLSPIAAAIKSQILALSHTCRLSNTPLLVFPFIRFRNIFIKIFFFHGSIHVALPQMQKSELFNRKHPRSFRFPTLKIKKELLPSLTNKLFRSLGNYYHFNIYIYIVQLKITQLVSHIFSVFLI